jgi:hypothetical protein
MKETFQVESNLLLIRNLTHLKSYYWYRNYPIVKEGDGNIQGGPKVR